MPVTKLSLYNDALRVIGAERLTSLTEAREPRYKLDEIYDLGAIEYCLKLAKPDFAWRVVKFTTASSQSTASAYQYSFALPSDFLSLSVDAMGRQTIYADDRLDQPITRFLREGSSVSCDYSPAYARYVANITDETQWSPEFVRLFTAYLGQELAERIAPHKYSTAKAKFEEHVELARAAANENDPALRTQKSDVTVTPAWLPIYNDALMICGLPHLTRVDDDSKYRVKLDVARSALAVDDLLADIGWNWAITSRKSVQNTRLETEWGYDVTHEKPTNLHRLDGIFSDEMMRCPLKDYQDEALNIHCAYEEIYIKYVSTDYLHDLSKWPAHFKRHVAGRLAYDIRNSFPLDIDAQRRTEIKDEFEMRERQSKNQDAMQSPPVIIRRGSWVRARTRGDSYRDSP